MPHLIGLTGPARAGKDTAYGFIREWAGLNGYETQRQGFADRLKLSACLALGAPVGYTVEQAIAYCDMLKQDPEPISPDYPEYGYTSGGWVESRGGKRISGREFLQRYGKEAHRDIFGDNFWVDALLPPADGEIDWTHKWDLPDDGIAVITDVRFDNEADAIQFNGGRVWKITRDSIVSTDTHSSEAGVSEGFITDEILNDGDLDGFRRKVYKFCDFHIMRESIDKLTHAR